MADMEKMTGAEKRHPARAGKKGTGFLLIAAAVLILAAVLTSILYVVPLRKYNQALTFAEQGDYEKAIELLEELETFRDSPEQLLAVRQAYSSAILQNGELGQDLEMEYDMGEHSSCKARGLQAYYDLGAEALKKGDRYHAAAQFGRCGNFRDALAKSRELWKEFLHHQVIAASDSRTLALNSDGTVMQAGGEASLDLSEWSDMISVSAGQDAAAGLRSDGKVLAAGTIGPEDPRQWERVIAVSSGFGRFAGVGADGKSCSSYQMIAPDGKKSKGFMIDLVDIVCGKNFDLGLRYDGTLIVGCFEEAAGNQVHLATRDWTDLIQVCVSGNYILGLRQDGTAVAAALSDAVLPTGWEAWSDLVAVSAGDGHLVGLCSDGTAVAAGANDNGQCEVEAWEDIVAVSAGSRHTVGLRRDGTAVTVGDSADIHWSGIRLPD